MASRNFVASQTRSQSIKRRKFQTTIAGDAGDGSFAVEITGNERLHHIAFKVVLEVQHVEREAQLLGDSTCIVNVIERTTSGRQRVTIFIDTDSPPLVPQLHRKTDQFVALLL